jgi:hypothetical protein
MSLGMVFIVLNGRAAMRRLMLKSLLARWVGVIFLVDVGLVSEQDSPALMTVCIATMYVFLLQFPFAMVTKGEKVLVEQLSPEELSHARPFALYFAGVAYSLLIVTSMAILSAQYWDPLFSTAKEGGWAGMYRLFVLYWVVPVLALIPATTACARIGKHGLSMKPRAEQV